MFHYFLLPLSDLLSFLNLFRYITFRTGGAMFTALLIMLIAGKPFIRWLKSRQGEGQPIRSDGPETHASKKGTPTMGGLLMIGSIAFSTLLWGDLNSRFLLINLFVMLGFGAVGFADDWRKLTTRSSNGVSGRSRLLIQASIAATAVLTITYLLKVDHATMLTIPFFKEMFVDLGILFIPFALIVIVGSGNAVNLTDGLDGLATMPVMIVAFCFCVISYLVGNVIFANYLQLPYVAGSGELAVFCGAMVGACLGFLWFNAPPAEVFMGDTGSLALGGALGSIAVTTKHEIVLAIIGGLFVLETLSVILQVASFRLTGKRVFRMAPMHHHFEKLGWPESKVVVRFWIIACIFAMAGLSSLKLR